MSFLRLLGEPAIEYQGRHYDLLAHKPVCLLVYLGFQGSWVSRELLASLFWPEDDESGARRNLRMLISRARQLPWADLEVENERLRWQVTSDVAAFREALGQANWEKVVALHTAPLLATWRINDMPGIEEWLELERESLQAAWRDAALHQHKILAQRNDHSAAAQLLQNLLRLDPLAEDVLAAYLESAYLAGQRDEALKAFESFSTLLKRELDLSPLQETQDLARLIRQSQQVPRRSVREKPDIPLRVLRPPLLIGREQAQAALEQSETPLTLIHGEPGVGKSRFLQEVLPEVNLLRCREGLQNVAYFPLAEYIRSTLPALPDLGPYLPDLARIVPEVLPDAVVRPDPQTAKLRLSEALALVFEGHTRPILIEDLQWSDSSTLEFLIFLSARGKCRLYGSYRNTEISETLADTLKSLHSGKLVTEISLQPLSADHMRHLLANLMETVQGPTNFSQWLSERSGGNPFFALETLRNLFESGLLKAEGGHWHSQLDTLSRDYTELEVPQSIMSVIERRFSRLSEATQRVLQAASVIREGFHPRLIAQVVGLSEWAVLEALEESEDHKLTLQDAFQHDLFRQSVYKTLPELRRKLLHRQLANVLSDSDPVLIADHLWLADEKERALPYYLQAVRQNLDKGLHLEAQKILIKLLPQVSQEMRATLEVKLATVYVESGQHPEAEAVLASLQGQVLPPRARADSLLAQAELLLHQGKLSQVAELIAALEQLPLIWTPEDQQNRSFLASQLAFYQGNVEQARQLLEALLPDLRLHGASSALVRALTDMASILDSLGQHQQAMKLHREGLDLARGLGARHLEVMITLNMLWGAMAIDRTTTEAVLPIAENMLELGEYAATMTLRNNLAAAYTSLEKYEAAVKHYQDITQLSQDPTLLSIAWARLAELHDATQSQPLLDKALRYLPQTEFAVAHISVGKAILQHGTFEQCQQVLPYLRPHLEQEKDLAELLKKRKL